MLSPRTTAFVVLLVVSLSAPFVVGPATAEDVTMTVTVIDQRTEPVSGVQVTADWDGGSVTETTRANGQALVDVPAGARVELDVSGSSYMRNHPQVVENATTRDVTVTVADEGQARITVVDEDGPIRGASVRLEAGGRTAASVETDADGVAQTGNVEQDDYTLRVRKPGYLEHRERLTVNAVTQHEVTLEDAVVGLDVTVQDTNFDPPAEVENASVQISPVGVTLKTLGTGTTTTNVAANRDYEITVSKDGYDDATREVSVGEEDYELTVNITREPLVNLTVGQRAIVVGETTQVTVTDEYERTVEDVAITIDSEEVARTNDEGTTTVRIDAAGEQTIAVNHDGRTANVTVEGVESADEVGENGSNQSTDGGIGPGFGAIVALVAVALAALALSRRH